MNRTHSHSGWCALGLPALVSAHLLVRQPPRVQTQGMGAGLQCPDCMRLPVAPDGEDALPALDRDGNDGRETGILKLPWSFRTSFQDHLLVSGSLGNPLFTI